MKIYTRKGDTGQTSLASGKRVSKANAQVELYGFVDELNSRLGFSYSLLDKPLQSELIELQKIQTKLFELGSELAGFKQKITKDIISNEDISFLESSIDQKESQLPTLTSFILPGGHPAASSIHLARTACRQLERSIIALQNVRNDKQEGLLQPTDFIKQNTLPWINRLSDYFFVIARFINFKAGIEDVKWN